MSNESSSESSYATFGQRLAHLRRRRGLSQRRLAELLCSVSGVATVSRNEVSRWERGLRTPAGPWLAWLAQVLETPMAEIPVEASRIQRRRWRALRAQLLRPGSGGGYGQRSASFRYMNDRVHPVDRHRLRSRVQDSLTTFLTARREHMTGIDAGLESLAAAIEAFVLGGGKRLRPAFAFWGYRGAGGRDHDHLVNAVASLELVQAGALIHDDLMDASDTRRGEPSMHRRFRALHADHLWHGQPEQFGSAAAILAGDLCLVWSDEMLHSSGVEPEVLARARPTFDRMRTEVMLGQYLDMHSQVTRDSSEERAGLVARYKTAKYTVEHPLLFGAALAGAPPALSSAYSAFGLPLGEAFQLRDDVLGIFGDPDATGKPAGDDLREGKRTYIIAVALDRAADGDRQLLIKALGDPQLDEETVWQLREIIVQCGALAATESRIERLAASALGALGAAELTGEAETVLRELAEVAAYRST